MADRSTRLLLIVLGAMFLQQTFATLGRSLPPIIAPAILDDLAIDPAWLGIYVGAAALSALLFQLGCGSFILRYGAMRMSQVALVLLGIGMAVATTGPLVLFLVSAVIGGGAAAMSTPASSHLLGRYSPPRQAPLVFSIKQTAVPAGLLVAGILGPWLTGLTGWRGTLLIAGLSCLVFAVMLEPLRTEFDSDRVPDQAFRLSDFHRTIASVVGTGDLRRLAFACFAFNGLQTVFTSYFVVALTELGHGLAAAGFVFSAAMVIAVPGRIFWGWLGSGRVDPAVVMCWLALGMAGGAAAMALLGPHWPLLLIGLVATVLSATVMSWHGVLLAEAARLAAPGQRGAATGGVLSFGQLGGLILPLVYSGVLLATGSYGLGFTACGLPALVVGIALLRAPRDADSR
ncbi:MFS transporter [Neoroseomonas oryzicola]|uniref:MFS transporter n=1 Tax=Neoroseomonas oryzicola TaxID=535904 RepID=A0A9X9WBX8_9PROT|nr:MFS transporter [Neoroseomonas oryzicola]MBR0657838.1 MFS transporter [Neoroseomonas oryzicola]NKE18594.1 MFS transporter [Neoroseomonas oryzicola]